MDVGVLGLVIPGHGVDYGPGLLAGRGVVEVDQGLAVDGLAQDGEVLPDAGNVEAGGRRSSRR